MDTGKFEWGRGIVCGGEANAGDFQENVLNVGKLCFSYVDMGEVPKLNIELARSMGVATNFETYQCAALNLAASWGLVGGGGTANTPTAEG